MAVTAPDPDPGTLVDWYDDRPVNKRNREKLAQSIRGRLDTVGLDWASSGGEVKMLDYACGNGFLSRIFAPHVSSIVAIDLSAVMIEKYKARIVELGPMQKNTSTLVGNLLSDPPEPPTLASEEYQDFHLITVGQALHQLPNDFGKCLAKLLRPGGVLYVQDLLDDGHHQGTETTRPRGLTLDELRSVMSGAGLIDCRFEVLPDELEIELPSEEVLKVRYFVARAMKPKVKRQPIPVH